MRNVYLDWNSRMSVPYFCVIGVITFDMLFYICHWIISSINRLILGKLEYKA